MVYPFSFEILRYEEARAQWPELPRPQDDEVRWVKDEVVIHGDFSLDESAKEELFAGAWVFAAGLTITGALTNAEMDSGPVLYVQQHLRAQRWWLTGCMVHIAGALTIERVLITEYNHGALVVDGLVTVPLLLNLDFDVTLRRGIRGEHVDQRESAAAYLPALRLWGAAALGRVAVEASPTNHQTSRDPIYAAAQELLEHWLEARKIALVEDAEKEGFTDELAVALEKLSAHYDPTNALGEWLMEHDAVADVLVEDEKLLPRGE